MVDSAYNPDDYRPLKINVGAKIKNPQMLRSVCDHRKTKKMCKHAVKNFSLVIRCVPNRYKTHQMCDKAVNTCIFVFDFVPK